MKSHTIVSIAALLARAALVASQGSFTEWKGPGPNDVRGPCPMLNTLANHGFIPPSGQNISLTNIITALNTSLNIDEDVATFLFNQAITTSTVRNATTFSLLDLARHNVLEHDASLSRSDAHFGDPVPFNQTIFDVTRQYWTAELITLRMAAEARLAAVVRSAQTNPFFSFSELAAGFAYGEGVAYVYLLGDQITRTVNRSFVEYMFREERLPVNLGWSRGPLPMTMDVLNAAIGLMAAITEDVMSSGASANMTFTMGAKRAISGPRGVSVAPDVVR